ncbi:MAG TPA: glycosyltransferase family 4 protein [Terriglobia bacterium]|nr:glycosyltransferase family 4 protein [Terriglobia bacterium]
MRILHIDTGTGWRGGQQQVLWLMEGCQEQGIEQRLLAPAHSPLAARAARAGLPVTTISRGPLHLRSLQTVRKLAGEADLVHAHDSRAHSLYCDAFPFRVGVRPPLVVSRRVGFPIASLGRSKYRIPALFIAVSEFVRGRLIEAGVPAEKIRVVFDGVRVPAKLPGPFQREQARRARGLAGGAFVFGTLSSFAPEKLLLEPLRLLRQLPETAHFWLGVPAAERDAASGGASLLAEARRLGLADRFQIVPVGENPARFFASLDLFLYLSRMEGLGSAILLAMAYALPVIASQVGGIPEIVLHQRTGLLVKNGAEHELPGAVEFLMQSAEMRYRLGAAGRRFVLAHATNDQMVGRTILLYRELGTRRSSKRSSEAVA